MTVQTEQSTTAGDGQQSTKLARVVASRIEQDIIERGWPTGEVIGSEPELLERYQVSRGVLREAVRLVEHKQIGRMRRGPGGGLVVTSPDQTPVMDAVVVYVRYAGVTLDELFEVRTIVEGAATELAAARLGADELDALRAQVAEDADPESAAHDHHALHRMIGELTANPAVELFSDLCTRLTALYVGSLPVSESSRRQWQSDSADAHAAIVDALGETDPQQAARRMRRHLEGLGDFLRARRASQTVLSELLERRSSRETAAKLGEELARTIFREVADQGWPVGEVLGSETALIERHDVSRAVLREAVRLLEYHQIARMRRGPGGGLVVTEPGVDAIAEAVTLYLEFRGIEPHHLYDTRVALELAAVDLAASRMSGDRRRALEESLERELLRPDADLNEVSHDLHLTIAELSGNRLLSLFLRILIQLSARHTADRGGDRDAIASEVHRVHGAIVGALASGDADVARRRMQRHLAALVDWYD